MTSVNKRKKKPNSQIMFRRTMAVVSAAALIGSTMLIITSCGSEKKDSSTSEAEMTYSSKIETTVTTTEPPEPVLVLRDGVQELLDRNADTAGWITIDGVVDEIVTQKPGDSELGNSYYIDHNLDGGGSTSGVIFADYRNNLNGNKTSDNIILYGHNQKDNTRLGTLDSYKWSLTGSSASTSYYKQHALVNFNTNYVERQYKIFSIFTVNTLPEHDNGNVFDYINYIDLSDEARYNEFISQITERSYINTGIDLQYGDKFLTLSTCGTEFTGARLVVVARQVREGESTDIDFSQCSVNSNPKLPAVFN